MSRRTERVNQMLKEEISDLLQRQTKDPRLEGLLISVTEVEVSPDLREAKVSVSVMAEEEQRNEAFRALEAASPFLHRELIRRCNLRYTPHLHFIRDDSMERAAHLSDIMRQLHEDGQD